MMRLPSDSFLGEVGDVEGTGNEGFEVLFEKVCKSAGLLVGVLVDECKVGLDERFGGGGGGDLRVTSSVSPAISY